MRVGKSKVQIKEMNALDSDESMNRPPRGTLKINHTFVGRLFLGHLFPNYFDS